MGAWIFKKMFGDGMAGVTGLEPAASGVTGQRSNQLSYTPIYGMAFQIFKHHLTQRVELA